MQKSNDVTDNNIQDERLLEEVDKANQSFLMISGAIFFVTIILLIILLCMVCSLKEYLLIILSHMY